MDMGIFVLGIDVTHVWSTIFRTYLDVEERKRYKKQLWLLPMVAFIVVGILSTYSEHLFWRVIAYFALFHFIRQQFGFLMLYKSKMKFPELRWISDKAFIYIATLYPVLVWHILGDRAFSWFVKGDFLIYPLVPEVSVTIGNFIYFFLVIVWVADHVLMARKNALVLPFGKILWGLSTVGTWWLGIVYFNSDFSFTLTNVVAHGIPYMALVFYYVEEKKNIQQHKQPTKIIVISILWMFLICLFLGLGEEFLWDVFINYEKQDVFGDWQIFIDSAYLRGFLIAFLSLPQVTHYLLDGVIWKGNTNPMIKKIFTPR
ncbi:hypothetical protein EI427_10790 [Flammeovirga pectinis]|uniref:Uncharacterized protein n=2 Tax=Flammeovirga pectinis TaxID=2494373 RepID=A0A3S9P3B8_9BACT|nr:hypothetical protein EI427_10790 [Flammeovirga pectinis]